MILIFSIAFVCLLCEAFFSSSEIAIVSADRAHIRRLAQAGNRGAKQVENFLQAPHKLLATTLLGTQLSLVLSTVVITLWLYDHFPPARAELYLILGLTPIIVTFGEIIPKSLVRQHANAWAPTMAWILYLCNRLFFPVVALLAKASIKASQKLGIEEHNKLISREELESLVSSSTPIAESPPVPTPGSDVTEGERSMIARIFELSDLTVADVMVPLSSVAALSEEATLADLVQEIQEKKYSRLPIYRERLDQIVGLVHAFDVLKPNPTKQTAGDFMRPVLFVPESHKAMDLLSQMQKSQQSLAVVVDEYGGAVGIVTQEDLLEIVVGEIEDEYDVTPSTIRKEADGSYRILAETPISQLNQELGLHLPESDEYESVAGLMLEKIKHIPKVGESIQLGTVRMVVVRANDRRIEEIRLHHA